MNSHDYWAILRFGNSCDRERALKQVEYAYAKKPDISHTIELGVAQLWVNDYEAASEHFHQAIERDTVGTTAYFRMAGVAGWCLGRPDEAVKDWSFGLDTAFKDTAGLGIHLPLLLFVASILNPPTFSKNDATRMLRGKVRDSRIKYWPGPVAKWIVGEFNEKQLRAEMKGEDQSDTLDRRWLADFYRAITYLEKGNSADFKIEMKRLADTSRPEWSDETFFLSRMWGAEFFIARHEAAKRAES